MTRMFGLLASVAFAALATPAAAQMAITVGQSVNGDLAEGDTRLSSGEYADSYELSGRAGQTITIRLNSSALDPYLMVRGPGGFTQDNDDISPTDRNAELVVRLPANGRYRIIATSYQPGERGRYALQVRAGDVATPTVATGPARADSSVALVVGRPVGGALDRSDSRISSGEYIDNWVLSGRRGESFDVTLRSTEFDPYLIIRGPGGLSIDNDDEDNRGSRNARVRFTLTADGDVRIGATSFRAGEVGRYALAVERAGAESVAESAPATPPTGGDARAITPGQRINGTLVASDRQLSTGEYADNFVLEGRAGQRIDLRLDSSEFDPFVQVNGPGNFVEANDDDPAGGRNSRLSVTLPSDGRYTVMVTSYAARETGAYSLRLSDAMSGDAATLAASEDVRKAYLGG